MQHAALRRTPAAAALLVAVITFAALAGACNARHLAQGVQGVRACPERLAPGEPYVCASADAERFCVEIVPLVLERGFRHDSVRRADCLAPCKRTRRRAFLARAQQTGAQAAARRPWHAQD